MRSTIILLLLATSSRVRACFSHLPAVPGFNNADQPPDSIFTRQLHPRKRTRTALRNVRVFDGYRIREPGTVIIDGDKIGIEEMEGDAVVEGKGRILIPGLIDSHCHVGNLAVLRTLTSFGVTTAINMACSSYSLCNSLKHQAGLASFISAGLPAVAPNSNHAKSMGSSWPMIRSTDDASALVSYAFGNGSEVFKIVAEKNGPSQESQNALVRKTHQRGKQSATHASDLVSYEQAVRSQTDSIQHTPSDGIVTQELIAQMLSQNQYVTPTMIIFKLLLNNPAALQYLRGSPNTTDSYDVVRKNVNLFHKAGLPILAGTDAVGKIPVIDIPHGLSLHWELENLVEAGMTPVEALRAATVVPAQRHAFHDRGIIEPGKRADLILLDENPLVNISNTRSIVKVWVGGMEFTS